MPAWSKQLWRDARGLLHGLARTIVVRLLVGLLALAGAADQAGLEPPQLVSSSR